MPQGGGSHPHDGTYSPVRTPRTRFERPLPPGPGVRNAFGTGSKRPPGVEPALTPPSDSSPFIPPVSTSSETPALPCWNGSSPPPTRTRSGASRAATRGALAGLVLRRLRQELGCLALARALLRCTRDLMILDEPSARLDADAEGEIHASITRHRRGRTSVLISHRMGSLRNADDIVVLSGGASSNVVPTRGCWRLAGSTRGSSPSRPRATCPTRRDRPRERR